MFVYFQFIKTSNLKQILNNPMKVNNGHIIYLLLSRVAFIFANCASPLLQLKNNHLENCSEQVSDAERNRQYIACDEYSNLDDGFFFKIKPKSQSGSEIQRMLVQLANKCNENTSAIYLLTASGKNAENLNFFFNGTAVLDFVTNTSDEEALVFFKRVAFADRVDYTDKGNQLFTVKLYSDILKSNTSFTTQGTIPSSKMNNIRALTNVNAALSDILALLKQNANANAVSASDITDMSIAAFLKEINNNYLVSSSKLDKAKGFCIPDYFASVQTCINIFNACEYYPSIDFPYPDNTSQNQHPCSYINIAHSVISQQITQTNNYHFEAVSHEIFNMFNEIHPNNDIQQQLSFVDITAKPLSPTVIEDNVKMNVKSAASISKKTNPKNSKKQVVTTSSSSTTIWYAAGGVVAVTIAVVVYIFVL